MEAQDETNKDARSAGSTQSSVQQTQSEQIKTPWLSGIGGFQLLLAFRLLNALLVRTFFQPDEYYQALEPAWQFAFGGRAAAWITWEWRQHLRSAIHPALFAFVYKVADSTANVLSLSYSTRADLLLVAPKVVQATIAATGEYHTWTLAQKIYGKRSAEAWTTLLLTVFSPWQWFCSTRTFSNCLETTLTIMALNEWPWDWTVPTEQANEGEIQLSNKLQLVGLRKALLYAATATVLRPTNILIWISVAVYTLIKAFSVVGHVGGARLDPTPSSIQRSKEAASKKVFVLLREAVWCGSAVLVMSTMVDRYFYGTWTFPPYNFLYFNVLQSLAVFYGNNNWHYYASEGYPLLLTTSLPYAIPSLIRIFNGYHSFDALPARSQAILRGLGIVSITLPVALSFLTHKEVRFIYPILPCLQIITALQASKLCLAFTTRHISADHINSLRRGKRIILAMLVPLSILIAGYATRVHNSGLPSLPEYLRHEFETLYLPRSLLEFQAEFQSSLEEAQPRNMTVAFLMPCHSVPWRSHLQYPPTQTQIGIQAWALTCEPPLHLTDQFAKRSYLDEADIFYDDPRAWIRRTMDRFIPISSDRMKHQGRSQAGIHVADKAMDYRNKKLWDSSNSGEHKQREGLDITDLLPQLATSPHGAESELEEDSEITTSTKSPYTRRPWPDYIAFFAQLEPTLARIISSYGTRSGDAYSECWRQFNSHWHDDWRRKGDVVVWCLNPPTSAARSEQSAGHSRWREGSGEGRRNNKDAQDRSRRDENAGRAVADRGNRGGRQTVVGRGGGV